jgi:hypothetical protein
MPGYYDVLAEITIGFSNKAQNPAAIKPGT